MVEKIECQKLCVMGCEKQADEKFMIKFFRKIFASELVNEELPFIGIAKKRG